MLCPQCQNQEESGSQFCTRCGYNLNMNPDPGFQQGFIPPPGDGLDSQGFAYPQDFLASQPGKSRATGSFVCGIIGLASTSILCCCLITMPAGLVLGIIAIVQGMGAKKLGYIGAKSTAGIVMGIFAIIISVLLMTYIVVAVTANPEGIQTFLDAFNESYELNR